MATATYDPRTGKKLRQGVTQDFSNFKGSLNFDARTGKKISSELLKPTKKIELTQPKPSVGAVGMNEEITSLSKNAIDQYTQNLQKRATSSEINKNTALDSYISNLMGQKGATELTTESYAKNVDPIESDLIDINNQIIAEEQANRRRIQALEKNPEGLLAGALNDEINRINNESLAKRADLSVIQMGIQGRYDSAKTIADRAISVQLERQRNINEALKTNYQEFKDLFDKDEQRAFESAQADRDRKLKREQDELQTISDLSLRALQNGAPSSIAINMRRAKTPEEAIAIGGGYIMSIDDRIKTRNYNDNVEESVSLTEEQKDKLLKDPTSKATVTMISVNNLLNDYKKLVEGFGGTPTRIQMNQANSYLTNVLGPSLAVAQGQGALQKDEAERLIDSLGVRQIGKREKVTLSNIDSAIRGFQSKINTNFSAIDSSVPGATDNFEIFKQYKISQLPPQEKSVAQKIQTLEVFRSNNYSDEDILEYFTEIDPRNAQTIRQLYQDGYELEEILKSF